MAAHPSVVAAGRGRAVAASTPNDVMAPLPPSLPPRSGQRGKGGGWWPAALPSLSFLRHGAGRRAATLHLPNLADGIAGCAAAAALTSPPISGYVVGRVAAATANLPCPPFPDPAASWGGQQRQLAAEKAARRQEVGGSTGELMAVLSPTRFSDGDAAPLPSLFLQKP